MDLIYMDEAGTSASEEITIVAAVTVESDVQWQAAQGHVQRIFDEVVPAAAREGFHFHATDVYSGANQIDRKVWSIEQRWVLLERMVGAPWALELPLSIGLVRNNDATPPSDRVSPEKFEHLMAFLLCLGSVHRHLTLHRPPDSLAIAIAEDHPEMRRLLRHTMNSMREEPIVMSQEHLHPHSSALSGASGKIEFGASRIIDCLHVASKRDAPLLQLADACAFAFRRYFSEQRDGDRLMMAMLGHLPNRAEWGRPSSSSTFYSPLRSTP